MIGHLRVLFGLALASFLFLHISFVFAEEEEKEYAPTGTLSSSFIGSEGTSVDGPWGGASLDSEDSNPLSGSVSKGKKGAWIARIFNNSEDRYKVNLEVVQYDKNRKVLARNNLSYVLKSGESKERSIRGRISTQSAELKIRSWKNLSARKKELETKEKPKMEKGSAKAKPRKSAKKKRFN